MSGKTQRRARPLWTRLRTTAEMVIAHGVRCAAPSVPGKEHDAAPAMQMTEIDLARPRAVIAQREVRDADQSVVRTSTPREPREETGPNAAGQTIPDAERHEGPNVDRGK